MFRSEEIAAEIEDLADWGACRISYFSGFSKTLRKSSPKLRGPGLTPQNLRAELSSNGSARAFQGPGSQPHLSDKTPKFSGPEVCTQQTLGVRHSVSQAAQQPQRTSSVSPHQRISPAASSCDRAALLCNLHFDYGVEQAYSAAARVQPRRSSQGALFLWIPSGIWLHGVSKRLEAPPAVPLERVDRYPFFSKLLSKKDPEMKSKRYYDTHTVKKLTEAQPESRQVHFMERAMDSPAPNLDISVIRQLHTKQSFVKFQEIISFQFLDRVVGISVASQRQAFHRAVIDVDGCSPCCGSTTSVGNGPGSAVDGLEVQQEQCSRDWCYRCGSSQEESEHVELKEIEGSELKEIEGLEQLEG